MNTSTSKEKSVRKKKKVIAITDERNLEHMNKKVSAEALLNSVNEQEMTVVSLNDIEIQVKRTLTLQESLAFIEGVVDSCIDYENGNYLSESYDFAIKTAILEFYTNVDVPDDVVSQYKLVYSTDIVIKVYDRIDSSQLIDNLRAIDKKIDFYVKLIHSTISSKVNDMVQKIDEFANSTAKIFDGVDPEKMATVIERISTLGASAPINEEAMARAILNIRREEETVPNSK